MAKQTNMCGFCKTSCCLSIIFFVSMIYFSYWKNSENNDTIKTFEHSLLPNQRQIFKSIKNERLNIYTQGYIIGLILSLCVVAYYRNTKCMTRLSMLCIIFSISFIVNYFYYILSPKSTYMVEHLETTEQKTWWVKVYRQMQFNYHMGFVFGILALLLLSNGICG